MSAATEGQDEAANNPETGTANAFRKNEQGALPAEAGDTPGTPVGKEPLADKGDLGKIPNMDRPGADGETKEELEHGEENQKPWDRDDSA